MDGRAPAGSRISLLSLAPEAKRSSMRMMVGRVVSAEPHPRADRIRIARIDVEMRRRNYR
jgi:tRNA-binding EMAP/Myf-like protein